MTRHPGPEWRNGIRSRLKIGRPQGHEGSTPSSGTSTVSALARTHLDASVTSFEAARRWDVNEMEPIMEPVSLAGADLRVMPVAAVVAAAYDAHASSIYGLALRSTRDPETAADITQEAFLRLVAEARRGRLPDNVGGWLYRTSANLIVSRAHRATVARRFAPRLVRRDEPDAPDAIAIGNEQHRELDIALGTLSIADRIALVMAAQGATGEEIAGHLGRSHAATRTHLTRARARLRAAVIHAEATR